jgi:hypothetical protein
VITRINCIVVILRFLKEGTFALSKYCSSSACTKTSGDKRLLYSAFLHFSLRGDHKTAIYYSLIRDIKMINDNVFMLRANVGMVQPGKSSIEPSKNAIQIMIGRWNNESGEIMLFQNTPAQFHGRPELSEKLTQELNALVK